jgi:glycosyltransferase involved in cell wall biosynthesis
MKRLAVSLNVAEYVTFTGRAPDEVMLRVLNTSDVCVNPDRANPMNDKSTMNKIMEYMALGKAIVQFDLTEGRVSAGAASVYARRNDPVDLADKIVQLLGDEAQRLQMGQIGMERVARELSWEHEVPRLLQAYDQLFQGSRTAERRM